MTEANKQQVVIEPPELGSLWDHHSGAVYRVLMLTNVHSTKQQFLPTVVYETCGSGRTWSRPLSQWHGSMKPQ